MHDAEIGKLGKGHGGLRVCVDEMLVGSGAWWDIGTGPLVQDAYVLSHSGIIYHYIHLYG